MLHEMKTEHRRGITGKVKHVYPHFSLSWAEIEVQTSLKPLLDKVWVSRHLTKAAIP